MGRKKRKNKDENNIIKQILIVLFFLSALVTGFLNIDIDSIKTDNINNTKTGSKVYIDLNSIPEYTGNPYIEINNNEPYFEEKDITTKAFENYSELDILGRCGVAFANVCTDIMPKVARGEIGSIYPSGWHTVKYNGIVEGNYLYNRCHLIGFQLAGENANAKNLITGTRYFNVTGMLPFENMVSEYIKKNKNNHVLYRVTPIYKDTNLVANGVEMEAYSVEDNGEGVKFNVFVYNVQPGIEIDYKTGESKKI